MRRKFVRDIITDEVLEISPPPTVRAGKQHTMCLLLDRKNASEYEEFGNLYSILCINCQRLVHTDHIEEHSKVCYKLSVAVEYIEKQPVLEQVVFKLKRLVSSLKDLIDGRSIKLSDKSVVVNMIRIVNPIFNSTTILELKKASEALLKVEKYFRGSLAVGIYIDRLKILVRSCIQNLENLKEANENQLPKIDIIEPASSARPSLIIRESTPSSSRKYVNSPKRLIDDIRSEFGAQSASSLTSTFHIEDRCSPKLEKLEYVSEEELRKYFYSLCLSLKIKHTSQKDVGSLSNLKLFREAKEQSIPPEDWFDFLESIFANPDKKYFEGTPRRAAAIKKRQKFEEIIEV